MALLEYDFKIVGASAIDRAFASIERRAIQHNRKLAQTFAQPVGRRSIGASASSGAGSAIVAERRLASESERLARRESAARMREEQKLARWRQTLQNRYWHNEAMRRNREDAAATRAAARMRARTVGTAARSIRGTLGAVGATAGTALAIGGSFAISGAVSQHMREIAAASRLANQANRPEIKGQLLREAQGVKGFSGEQTLGALEAFYTPTGDLDAARAAAQDLGKLALATGTDFGEMAGAAGAAFNVIRDSIKDPQKRLEALKEVMGTLTEQGSMGAIEIRDMVTELKGLGAASRKFEGGPVELLKSMGAMAQAAVARGGAASAAEATTAVTRFAADLTKSPAQKALRGMSVDIFADKGKTKLKDPREIMADILGATRGDLTKIEAVMNAESAKVLAGFSPMFLDAAKKAESEAKAGGKSDKETRQAGRDAGRDALLAEFNRFANAKTSQESIDKRAASRLSDPDLQYEEEIKKFRHAIGSELLPQLTRMVPAIAEATPKITALIKSITWVIDKFGILGTLGGVIVAKVTADIAAARIGDAITRAVLGGGGGIGGAAGGMLGGAGGGAGKMLAGGAGGRILALGARAGLVGAAAAVTGYGMHAANEHSKRFRGQVDAQRRELEGTGLSQFGGVRDQGGGIFTQSAGLDPNLLGSPASIQSNFGQAQGPLDMSAFAVASNQQTEAAKTMESASAKMSDAASKISLTLSAAVAQNRGNTPSPVK